LEEHKHDCLAINGTQAVRVKEGSSIIAEKFKYKLKVPFIIYADSEALIVAYEKQDTFGVTQKTHKHVACPYEYKCCLLKKL